MQSKKFWTVVLAGGQGCRMESSELVPKPMVNVGDNPLLWEVLQVYKRSGLKNFLICLGFGAQAIIDYFLSVVDGSAVLTQDGLEVLDKVNGYRYLLVDTGLESGTGSRISQVIDKVPGDVFFLTYSDGLSDVDVSDTYDFHKREGNGVTLLSVRPNIQYGVLNFSVDGKRVEGFLEKPLASYWINAGFFVINKNDLLPFCNDDEKLSFEQDILPLIATSGSLGAYRHDGFWMSADTKKDLINLREKWSCLNLL